MSSKYDSHSSKYIQEILSIPAGEGCELKLEKITASVTDSANILVKKMVKENTGAVVVVEGGRAIGIVTEKDLLDKVIKPLKDMDNTLAKDVMSKPLISIEYNRPMKEALDLIRKHKIRRLVVTKKGAFFGLITERRFLEAAFLVI